MTDSNTRPTTDALEKIFAIDADNAIASYGHDEVPEGAVRFSNESELAALAVNWNTGKLVEIWNRPPRVTALKKFTNRQTAVKRIWAEVRRQESTKIASNAGPCPTPPSRFNPSLYSLSESPLFPDLQQYVNQYAPRYQ
jgi:hypothetical protein